MQVLQGISSIGAARCASLTCSVCADIPPAAKHELARIARIRSFRAGETVVAEAEEIGFIGNVVSGVLRMQKTLHDGRQQIVGLLLPADTFGRVFAQASHVAIEASTEATLCCYNRVSFEALFRQFPELEHRMLVSSYHELDAAQDWILLLAKQTVTERVATFLLILGGKRSGALDQRPGPRKVVEVPVARKDMAAYLGTTVESISRSIQQMARGGAIRVIDTRHFEVLDLTRLLDLSGHDPSDFAHEDAGRRRGVGS